MSNFNQIVESNIKEKLRHEEITDPTNKTRSIDFTSIDSIPSRGVFLGGNQFEDKEKQKQKMR